MKYRSVFPTSESKKKPVHKQILGLCVIKKGKNVQRKLFLGNYWLRFNNYYFIILSIVPHKFFEYPLVYILFFSSLLPYRNSSPCQSIFNDFGLRFIMNSHTLIFFYSRVSRLTLRNIFSVNFEQHIDP